MTQRKQRSRQQQRTKRTSQAREAKKKRNKRLRNRVDANVTKKMQTMQNKRDDIANKRASCRRTSVPMQEDPVEMGKNLNVTLCHCTTDEKSMCFEVFETSMRNLGFCHCLRCKRVGMSLNMSRRSGGLLCTDCCNHPGFNPIEENMLPIWFDEDGKPMFHVPEELCVLREGEKLLIQMVSPYIPFVHIKNGTLGMKGHVCSFPQRVQDVCTTLPRLPSEATFVKMVRHFKGSDGDFGVKSFCVRKKIVIDALKWLVKHNVIYRDSVTIDETNLDWIGDDDEAELPSVTVNDAEDEATAGVCSSVMVPEDKGPAELQCLPELACDDELDQLKTCGIHVTDSSTPHSQNDEELEKAIKDGTSQTASAPWPYVSSDPVSEYDTTEKLYCKAFPWLFPGGVGDINDYRERTFTASEWARRLLDYEDGRFASDKMWCFFALNYCTRRRNQDSGRFFVNGFDKNTPQSMDELKEKLRNGETGFLDKITYYSKRVRGSSGYWRHKRAELYSWINYHVSQGNGMPNFFITLSCAEYFWPDVIRLINERLRLAGHPDAVSETRRGVRIVGVRNLGRLCLIFLICSPTGKN